MKRSAALAAAAALTLAVTGCASANKESASGDSSMPSSMPMASSNTGSGSAGGVSASNSSVSGMSMSSGTTTVLNAQGVPTPVPVRTIGSGDWKDMKITAQEMTPVPFYVYNGSSFSEIKPTKQTSFHLMVMLTDKRTGVDIPYATVWATFYKKQKMVYTDKQYPMLAEYMGPHYGNDVSLPGAGTYEMKLLVSAPEAALHTEYNKMWVGDHTLTTNFTWAPPAT
jgi:hypothetical protein